MQRFGNGRCKQRDGCFILRSVYFVHFGIFVQWDASLLYLDVDICNGRQHGFIYPAAVHFIIVCIVRLDAATRIAFGFEVHFPAAMSFVGFGSRTFQWHRSFAMHVVAAGWYAQGYAFIFSVSRFGAVMRVAIGISQGVGFSPTMFVNFSFAMSSVAAGCYAHGRGRRHGCRCSSLRLPSIPGRLIRDAFVHTGQV